jgi:hypothetical protein
MDIFIEFVDLDFFGINVPSDHAPVDFVLFKMTQPTEFVIERTNNLLVYLSKKSYQCLRCETFAAKKNSPDQIVVATSA